MITEGLNKVLIHLIHKYRYYSRPELCPHFNIIISQLIHQNFGDKR